MAEGRLTLNCVGQCQAQRGCGRGVGKRDLDHVSFRSDVLCSSVA